MKRCLHCDSEVKRDLLLREFCIPPEGDYSCQSLKYDRNPFLEYLDLNHKEPLKDCEDKNGLVSKN